MATLDINYKGRDLRVDYDYQPEEPEVRYYSDGSGYPGCGESFNINGVYLNNREISNWIDYDDLEEAIYKDWESNGDY